MVLNLFLVHTLTDAQTNHYAACHPLKPVLAAANLMQLRRTAEMFCADLEVIQPLATSQQKLFIISS